MSKPSLSPITTTTLRANLARLLDRVTDDREMLVVTRPGGKGNVVILAEEEFDGWRETAYLLSQPAMAAWLHESIRQARAGAMTERDLLTPDGRRP